MEKAEELRKLNEELEELKKHNPSHCHDSTGFVDHNMPVRVYQRIEEIEARIKELGSDG